MVKVNINSKTYIIKSLKGSEKISYGYDFSIVFESYEPIEGNVCGAKIAIDNFICGIIIKFSFEYKNQNKYFYSCDFCSYIQYYCRYRSCKIFKNTTLKQLISSLLGNIPSKMLFIENPQYPFFIQYNTSSHDIINYLCHMNGLAYFFDANMVYFIDSPLNAQKNLELYYSDTIQSDINYVNQWKVQYNEAHNLYISSFNKTNPNMPIINRSKKDGDFIYKNDIQNNIVREKYEKLMNLKPIIRYSTQTCNNSLHVGIKVALKNNELLSGDYFVNSVVHYYNSDEEIKYHNTVELISTKDLVYTEYIDINNCHLQTAIVSNNANANKGVLSIKFHWSDVEIEASVLQLVAGNSYGTLFMPQIGESVLVGFEENNALCPFIYGAFYDGANVSTYLPMQSGIKIQNNNIILRNDGMDVIVEGDFKEIISESKNISINKNRVVLALDKDTIRIQCNEATIIIHNNEIKINSAKVNINASSADFNINNMQINADNFSINAIKASIDSNIVSISSTIKTTISSAINTDLTSPAITVKGVVVGNKL